MPKVVEAWAVQGILRYGEVCSLTPVPVTYLNVKIKDIEGFALVNEENFGPFSWPRPGFSCITLFDGRTLEVICHALNRRVYFS